MGCQFDRFIDRRNTLCRKWDGVLELYGKNNLLPMWIADMDFRPPQQVIDSVCRRAAHGVYGYEKRPDSFLEAAISWLDRRHQWQVKPEWFCHSPGVVSGLALALQLLTESGDQIVIQPPVYPPFYSIIRENKRQIVESPLLLTEDGYKMDFDHLETVFANKARAMILCSPHNPVGRVWSRAELEQLATLAMRYQVLILSDEIWADLAFAGHKHYPISSLSPDVAEQTLTFMAPSKTFNLAGFYTSNVIIPNRQYRELFTQGLQRLALHHSSFFGLVAAETAYRNGDQWLDELLAYLQDNVDFVLQELAEKIPTVKARKPEGTFVLWLDCRDIGVVPQEINDFLVAKAGLALNDGCSYGAAGYGFQRMNIGCPRSIIAEALSRMGHVLN